tara:strand:+ start:198 stop:719 length:522 start_codon:yes stop_codon:yes gene_type:complete
MSMIRFIFWTSIEKFLRLLPLPQLRVFFLRLLGSKIDKGAIVHEVVFQNVYVKGAFSNLVMGENSTIQPGCILDLADQILINDKVTISQGVIIMTHSDPGKKMGKPLAEIYPPKHEKVVIGKGAWIGAGAIIYHGITIGECALVGAGSFANKDIPPYSLYAGVPARMIKEIRL